MYKRQKEINALPKSLVACPLMHGTGMWLGAFLPLLTGGSVITVPNSSFDPDEIWEVVQARSNQPYSLLTIFTPVSGMLVCFSIELQHHTRAHTCIRFVTSEDSNLIPVGSLIFRSLALYHLT